MKDLPFDAYDFFGYLASGLMVLCGLDAMFHLSDVMSTDMETLKFLVIVLASYVLGQMLATPAKGLLEDLIVRFLLGRPSVRLMGTPGWKDPRRYFALGYFEPLRPQVQTNIRTRAAGEGFEMTGKQDAHGIVQPTDASGEDLFIHVRFRPDVRSDEPLMARMDAYLNKYGFNRNVCFASLCLAIAVYVEYRMGGHERAQYLQYARLLGVMSLLLFYRYLKFLRLYSYELFNAYAAGPPPPKPETQASAPKA